MATETEINAVTDIIVNAFGGDISKFTAFLTRAALETELAEIESDLRNLQEESDTSASGYISQVGDIVALKNAKVAEIDALS